MIVSYPGIGKIHRGLIILGLKKKGSPNGAPLSV
jgi:hypothetical protein